MQTASTRDCDTKNLDTSHSALKQESMDDLTNPNNHGGVFSSGDMTTTDSVISDLFRASAANLVQWDQGHSPSEQQQPLYSNTGENSRGTSTSIGHQEHPDSGASSVSIHDSGDEGNSDDDGDSKPSSRKRRNPVPDEKKDMRYWEKRKKNNMAAKKSRESKRKKLDDEIKVARDAVQENQKLKQEIEVLKSEINSLRRLLKDANMTLSLWIRARQASEPNTQLPPMLRSPNISFVNFPVSSTV